MYNVTPKFHQLAIQPSSKTRCRIYFIPDTVDCTDDNDVITNGTLLVRDNTDTDSGRRISGDTGVIFSNYFNTEKNIQLGCCVSNQVEMHLLNLDGALTNFTFGRCKIFLDVYNADNGTWLNCPMGVYILEQPVNSDQNVITVHGFDQMQLLDAPAETWWNTIDWSTGRISLYKLLTGICTAVGVPWSAIIEGDRNIRFMTYPYTPMDISTKSFRDVLKQIAESTGSMAYFTRNGELDLRWFSYAKMMREATYTGQIISITDDPEETVYWKTVYSLTVPITPTQNLNGYTKPWPAGGGKNKLNPLATYKGCAYNPAVGTTLNPVAADKSWQDAGNDTFIISNLGSWEQACLISDPLPLGKAYVKISNVRGAVRCSIYVCNGDFKVNRVSFNENPVPEGGTIVVNTTFTNDDTYFVVYLAGSGADASIQYPYAYSGYTAAIDNFSPYSNICPLIGLTGLSEYVSPTQDQQDATTYSVDWTAEAGTVYGGSYEAVSGALKSRPYIASYNGETLVGPWVSSMDEYVEGTTPTTGAEVVDLGGAETVYQLVTRRIHLDDGQNYLWASNGETLTAVIGIQTGLTIDTDKIGNQCLSICIANYNVEKFGRIETRLGTSKLVQTKTSAAYPNPKNQYLIDGNAFLNPNAPPLTTDEYIYVILERLWDLTPYTPIQTRLILDWSVDAGDIIQIKRNNVIYVFPIFQISMTWRGGNVVADVTNDGDVVKPYTDGIDDQNKGTISKFVVNGGTGTVSTDVSFTPGESALVVISGAAGVRTAAFIVYCGADGTILKRDISSGSAYSYVTSTPYTVTIKNSSHNNNSGLKISF